MLITERINKVITSEDVSTKEQLLIFWEQHYRNFTEDAKINEYNELKKGYFVMADEYESLLRSDPSKIGDELLYKKFMIIQRKIGIRMIALAAGTEYEEEAKTFESQASNTPAGDRSVSNIKNTFESEIRTRAASRPWGSTGEEGKPITTFSDFIKVVIASKAVRKRLIMRILFYLSLELLAYLINIYMVRQLVRKSPKNEYWSNLIGDVIDKDIDVKIVKSNMYTVFGCSGMIAISQKIIDKFSEEEVIALSLYSYGSTVHAVSRGIGLGTLKFIMVTSIEMGLTYMAVIDIHKQGGGADTSKIIYKIVMYKTISEVLLTILLSMLRLKLEVIGAIKYVKDKGYLNQLMAARRKLPKKRAERIPDIDAKTAEVTVGLFTKFLGIIGLKKSIEKDNISKPVSTLKKATAIFRKFK